ncbi:MAG: NAD(P)-dependent oxidoreductase, partial [Chloroflexi bacterium]|nr:NAD(P)-dependent oxidoreductase [Chloroflexota bacterium]
NVFEAARLMDVQRVVYASSISTYGDQSSFGERPITEEDVPAPRNIYGTAKLLNDREAALYRNAYGSSLIGIRIASVFGHGRLRGRSAWAGRFASDPAVGRTAEFPFAPAMRWSMVYVDDAARLFVDTLMAPNPQHAIYNCSAYDLSLGEMAAAVRELIPDAKHTFGSGVGPTPHLVDSTRAQKEYGWQPKDFVENLKAHIAEARAAA